jgi:hypothetical protein
MVIKNIIYLIATLLVCSCQTKENDRKMEILELNKEDSDCKLKFAESMYKNSINIYNLGYQNGFKKELDEFDSLRVKSNDNINIPCDSLKKVWNKLSDKINK